MVRIPTEKELRHFAHVTGTPYAEVKADVEARIAARQKEPDRYPPDEKIEPEPEDDQ